MDESTTDTTIRLDDLIAAIKKVHTDASINSPTRFSPPTTSATSPTI